MFSVVLFAVLACMFLLLINHVSSCIFQIRHIFLFYDRVCFFRCISERFPPETMSLAFSAHVLAVVNNCIKLNLVFHEIVLNHKVYGTSKPAHNFVYGLGLGLVWSCG